jgi:hypothetical protein
LTFIAPDGHAIRVTRRAAELFGLPDATEVLAHWMVSFSLRRSG